MSVKFLMTATEEETQHMKEQLMERLAEEDDLEKDEYTISSLSEGTEVNPVPEKLMDNTGMDCEECGGHIEKRDILYQFVFVVHHKEYGRGAKSVEKYEICKECHMKWQVKDAL